MNTQRKTQLELDLMGSQIRHHLAAVSRYAKKIGEHELAAGIMLAEVRPIVSPHFDNAGRTPAAAQSRQVWYDWLELHGIDREAARKAIYYFNNPDKREARAEQQKEYNATRPERAAGKSTYHEVTPSPPPKPSKRTQVADESTAKHTRRSPTDIFYAQLKRKYELTDEQVQKLTEQLDGLVAKLKGETK